MAPLLSGCEVNGGERCLTLCGQPTECGHPSRLLKESVPDAPYSAGILPASVEFKAVAGWKPALRHCLEA